MSRGNHLLFNPGIGLVLAFALVGAPEAAQSDAAQDGAGDSNPTAPPPALEAAPAPTPEAEHSRLSGSLAFDINTNFLSYGLDVWNTGNFGDAVFNPSLYLEWDLGRGFTANLGTWWDVNNNDSSSIGGSAIQEVDIWVGAGYAWETLSVAVTYQQWMFLEGSERSLDFSVGAAVLFNPTFSIHARISPNKAAGQLENGAIFVLGAALDTSLGPIEVSVPLELAFLTDGYYQPGQGGFGYFAVGIQTSTPLSSIPSGYGSYSINAGGTYYHTDTSNIANAYNDIFTMKVGVRVDF